MSALRLMEIDCEAGVRTIHDCAGPPACLLQNEAAIAAQLAGCVWCTRTIIDDNGREAQSGPGHA